MTKPPLFPSFEQPTRLPACPSCERDALIRAIARFERGFYFRCGACEHVWAAPEPPPAATP